MRRRNFFWEVRIFQVFHFVFNWILIIIHVHMFYDQFFTISSRCICIFIVLSTLIFTIIIDLCPFSFGSSWFLLEFSHVFAFHLSSNSILDLFVGDAWYSSSKISGSRKLFSRRKKLRCMWEGNLYYLIRSSLEFLI